MMHDVLNRIKRKWMKMRLQPIRVFCFHQVSEQFDSDLHCKPDWMSLSELKQKVQDLRKAGYVFVSLLDAHRHLKKDWIRCKKYAVLTCDDGLKCQAALIPWMEEEKIPMTMFITVKNLDGETCAEQILKYMGITDKEDERRLAQQLYLSGDELKQTDSSIIEIGMHGYEHIDYAACSCESFRTNVDESIRALSFHKKYVPFYAYPFGKYTKQTDDILKGSKIIPVYVDGMKNYNEPNVIHRELL